MIGRRIFGVAALAAALALSTAAGAWAEGNSLDDIVKAGVVRIGVPTDFPPFGSVGPDMQPEGYDVEVAGLIAKDLGVKLELVPVTSANRVPYLQTKKVDLVISSLGVNPERARAILFSQPYAPYFSGVFGPPDIKVAGAADLKGQTIAVTRGTLEDLELSKIAPKEAVIKRYEDAAATTSAFLSGQTQLVASGNVAIAALAKSNPDKQVEKKFVIKDSPCSIGLRRSDTDLRDWVNVFIYHKKLGGELNALSVKWFGEPLPVFPTI
jgi:polar amino acid transport system substrate-binding protein